jgi:hypothetical protein
MKRSRPAPVFVVASGTRQRLLRDNNFLNETPFTAAVYSGWKKFLLMSGIFSVTGSAIGVLALDGSTLALDGSTLALV